MGTEYSYHLYYGVNVRKEDRQAIANVTEKYYEDGIGQRKEDKFDILMDGMCGEYYLIGRQLWRETMYMDGDGCKEIKISNFDAIIKEVTEDFKKHYPEHAHLLAPWNFGLYAVPHAS